MLGSTRGGTRIYQICYTLSRHALVAPPWKDGKVHDHHCNTDLPPPVASCFKAHADLAWIWLMGSLQEHRLIITSPNLSWLGARAMALKLWRLNWRSRGDRDFLRDFQTKACLYAAGSSTCRSHCAYKHRKHMRTGRVKTQAC